MADEVRCAGCGKPIEAGDEVTNVTHGKMGSDGKLARLKEWGKMHRTCHNRRADSPQAALEELRASEKKRQSTR